jgi:translation initiation factor IF-1
MSGETPIRTIGTITESFSNGTFHAALPNGKIVLAHPDREAPSPLKPPLASGDRVHLELIPYDFSKARLAGRADDPPNSTSTS